MVEKPLILSFNTSPFFFFCADITQTHLARLFDMMPRLLEVDQKEHRESCKINTRRCVEYGRKERQRVGQDGLD